MLFRSAGLEICWLLYFLPVVVVMDGRRWGADDLLACKLDGGSMRACWRTPWMLQHLEELLNAGRVASGLHKATGAAPRREEMFFLDFSSSFGEALLISVRDSSCVLPQVACSPAAVWMSGLGGLQVAAAARTQGLIASPLSLRVRLVKYEDLDVIILACEGLFVILHLPREI